MTEEGRKGERERGIVWFVEEIAEKRVEGVNQWSLERENGVVVMMVEEL